MSSVLLVGNSDQINTSINIYIKDNNILPYEIETYEDKLTISEARSIKRTLAFVVSQSKLFALKNTITIEAQNALLKIIEEAHNNVHFIFCANNEGSLLPTIRSRCKIVRLDFLNPINNDEDIYACISRISSDEGSYYEELDRLAVVCEKDLKKIIPVLRNILLDERASSEKRLRTYAYCKRLLKAIPLVESNNVNEKVILDSVFTHKNTP